MKLFSKYSRISITASILVFAVGCIAFYLLLNYILTKQVDETLETEQQEIVQYAAKWNAFPEIINTDDQQIHVEQVSSAIQGRHYTSAKLWNEMENQKEWMRQLVFGVSISGNHYKVTVKKSEEQSHHLQQLIVLLASAMIALILVIGIIINRILLKRLWQPFYVTLSTAANYSLDKQSTLDLPKTKIEEFNLLNETLNGMTHRIHKDYQTLKEFTGNAAHEMQTPLAVIIANAESLMQDEAILKLHHPAISSIEQSANRLSRLNQSLLLLAKIESHRFQFTETVLWKALIEKQLDAIQELLYSKKITLHTHLDNCVTIFNQQFAVIVITNLLNNAIRYNLENGSIHVTLNQKELLISNTATLPELDSEKVFKRFYRHPQSTAEGNGLGLSIVQQICTEAGYTIHYQYVKSMHCFRIIF